MALLTRAEARSLGLLRYNNGRPCPAGHPAERFVSSGSCAVCAEENRPKKAKRHTECKTCGTGLPKELKRGTKYCSDQCRGIERSRVFRGKSKEKALVNAAKARAKARDLPYDITHDDIEIPEHCPVLGIKLETQRGNLADCSPSIDRMIPELGYVKGNVRVISHRANRIKFNATPEELRSVLAYVEEAYAAHCA